MDVSGKVVIVTGAGSGTGLAVAERFVAAGATVVIAEIDALAGALAADALDNAGEVYFIDADVASEPSVKAVAERVMTAYGRIDFLVNCASLNRRHPVTELSMTDWQRVIGVNLTGAYLFAKYCAKQLSDAGGAIVSVASSQPAISEPDSEAYAASKAGLVGLTRSLAVSLAPNIRVNCISPAWAGAAPEGETAVAVKPADIAEMAFRLCTDDEIAVTGSNVTLAA